MGSTTAVVGSMGSNSFKVQFSTAVVGSVACTSTIVQCTVAVAECTKVGGECTVLQTVWPEHVSSLRPTRAGVRAIVEAARDWSTDGHPHLHPHPHLRPHPHAHPHPAIYRWPQCLSKSSNRERQTTNPELIHTSYHDANPIFISRLEFTLPIHAIKSCFEPCR